MKNLKKLRQEANLSQEELAQKAGISRVANALNVDPKVLLCNEEYVDITKD